MLCFWAVWSKGRSPVGRIQKKLTGSDVQMLRDILYLHRLQIPHKKSVWPEGKSMPCVHYNDNSCNFQKHHETKGVFYRHNVVHVLPRKASESI